ncbi:MAG: hypothetical protein BWK80_22300 [Desulfobacteraceae bacterium IS3]|nr:MAG: hypothetical protein BWK80_22300 [Desulfobacteraceae bacterium IS3]
MTLAAFPCDNPVNLRILKILIQIVFLTKFQNSCIALASFICFIFIFFFYFYLPFVFSCSSFCS